MKGRYCLLFSSRDSQSLCSGAADAEQTRGALHQGDSRLCKAHRRSCEESSTSRCVRSCISLSPPALDSKDLVSVPEYQYVLAFDADLFAHTCKKKAMPENAELSYVVISATGSCHSYLEGGPQEASPTQNCHLHCLKSEPRLQQQDSVSKLYEQSCSCMADQCLPRLEDLTLLFGCASHAKHPSILRAGAERCIGCSSYASGRFSNATCCICIQTRRSRLTNCW